MLCQNDTEADLNPNPTPATIPEPDRNSHNLRELSAGFPYTIYNLSASILTEQDSKLDFLKDKSISNAKKSPYYWSAFVYYGGIETAETPTNYYFYILGLLILIGLFLVFKHFRK